MNKTTSKKQYGFSRPELNYIIGVVGTMVFIIAGKGFSYLFQLSLTYSFGTAIAGIFTLWFTSLHIASFLSKWGLDMLAVQLIPKYKADLDQQLAMVRALVKSAAISTLIFLGAWLLSYEWVAKSVLQNPDLKTPFAIILLIIIPMNTIFLVAGFLRGFGHVFSCSSIQYFSLPFTSFISLYVANKLLGFTNPLTPIIAFSFGIGISSLAAIWIGWNKGIYRSSSSQLSQKLFSSGTPFALSNLAFFLISWMDTLFIGYYLNNESVGVFNLILRVAMIISLPVMGINSVIGPRISDSYFSKQYGQLIKNIKYTIFTGAGTALPILGGILLFQGKILSIFGPEFSEAAAPFIILASAHFIYAASGSAGLSLQMIERAKDFQYILGSAVLLKVFLAIFLIPKFGLIGTTIGILITTVYWQSITWFILTRRLKKFKIKFW